MRISDWSSDVCSSDLSNYSLSCHTTALGWIKTEELYMTEQFSVRPIGGGMSELLYDEGLRRHMLQVYNYMGLGLAVTGLVAFGVAATPSLYQAIFGTSLTWVAMFAPLRSEEHTSELQSLMRISYAGFCLK